jgi:hypothetical protein
MEAIKAVLEKPYHIVTVSELKEACKLAGITFDDCCPGCVRNAYSQLFTEYKHLIVSGSGKAKFKEHYSGYRFPNDTTVYTNKNLTDAVAREILRINPGAHIVFATLPDEVVSVEPTTETAPAPKRTRKAQ